MSANNTWVVMARFTLTDSEGYPRRDEEGFIEHGGAQPVFRTSSYEAAARYVSDHERDEQALYGDAMFAPYTLYSIVG